MHIHILTVSFIIVLWWIAIWGLLDTLFHSFIQKSRSRALFVYGSLATFVLLLSYWRPEILEHFI